MKRLKNERGAAIFGVIGLLAIIYFYVLYVSMNGWGYMGYYGYHRGPSFFYWGGPSTYYDRNIRNDSRSGPGYRGGGFHGGK